VIPRAHITAWRSVAPWPANEQVEQDLVLSRALVAMSGNVSEWCQDWSHGSYEGAPTDRTLTQVNNRRRGTRRRYPLLPGLP
jgi:formylglycine-generating enzyme required for sulfatase activity